MNDIEDKYSKMPFKLPENYFEQFSTNMQQFVAQQPAIDVEFEFTEHSNSLVNRRGWWISLSAAAVVAGLLIGGYTIINMQNKLDKQVEQIVAQDSYIETVADELDSFEVEEILADMDY